MKKILSFVLAVSLCLSLLAGCGTAIPADRAENAGILVATEDLPVTDRLVVYTNTTEAFLNLIVPTFEEKYGVRVEVITASAGELINRLIAEADDPIADVAMIGGRTQFADLMHLFSPFVSSHDHYMAPHARNVDGYFNGVSVSLHPILINRNVVCPSIVIEGYACLLQPELEGLIVFGNAAASNSAFFHLLQILIGFARDDGTHDYESESGWEFMAQLMTHGIMLDSSGAIHRSVADGEYGIALTWEDPFINYVRDGATHLEAVYPREALLYGGGHAAVVRYANNRRNAQLFIDHVQSHEIQESFQISTSSRPARMGVSMPDYFITFEALEEKLGDRLIPYPDDFMLENTSRLHERFTDLMTRVLG